VHDPEWEYEEERDLSPVSHHSRHASRERRHSRSRHGSRDPSPFRQFREEDLLIRQELEKYKKQKWEDEQIQAIKDRLKSELEEKRTKEEKAKQEEKEREKALKEKAIEEYKKKEQEKKDKEKAEKEKHEREFKDRMIKQLQDAGLDDMEITTIVKGDNKPVAPNGQPLYTKMSRRHVSIETLRVFGTDWKYDETNPDYVIIKRWVPKLEQHRMWDHTRMVRETRSHHQHQFMPPMPPHDALILREEDLARDTVKKKPARKSRGFLF
jgi:hypothetical protein